MSSRVRYGSGIWNLVFSSDTCALFDCWLTTWHCVGAPLIDLVLGKRINQHWQCLDMTLPLDQMAEDEPLCTWYSGIVHDENGSVESVK